MTTSTYPRTVTIRGGTFTAAPERPDANHGCEGCAGHGRMFDALCTELPDGCATEQVIWVASKDPVTTAVVAEFMLEAS